MKQYTGNRLYTLTRVLLFCFCSAVVLAIASGITKTVSSQWQQQVLLLIAIVVTFILTLLFTRWEKLTLHEIGVSFTSRSFPRICIGLAIGLAMAFLQPLLVLVFGHIKFVASPSFNATALLLNFMLYILVAWREELAFRAYPLRSLAYAIGPWKAQLIIAAIFSTEHLIGGMNLQHAVFGAGIGAIFFGLAALRTKGLALPIGLHIAWNFGQWCVGFKEAPGIWQAIVEKGYENRFDIVNSGCYLFVMILAITTFYFCWNKKQA